MRIATVENFWNVKAPDAPCPPFARWPPAVVVATKHGRHFDWFEIHCGIDVPAGWFCKKRMVA
jgi:hypothetical protein